MATYANGVTVPSTIDATTALASQNSDPATGAGHGEGLSAPAVTAEVTAAAVRNTDQVEEPKKSSKK